MQTQTEPDAQQADCPSAQPDMAGAQPFGVISGSPGATRIAFFKKSAVAVLDWQRHFAPGQVTKVLRFAARCEQGHCTHYSAGRCSLGQRVATSLPAVVDVAPPCLVRPTCRWHAENGIDVCLRCPQVVTMIPHEKNLLNEVAQPA